MHLNTTVRHIEHLLLAHNCVIVPGLGTFWRHTSPATLSAEGVKPPSCSISFSTDIDSPDDKTLAMSLARATGKSEAECEDTICNDVFAIRRAIAGGEAVQIGRLGSIDADGDKLVFTQSAGWTDPRAYLWAPVVDMPEIVRPEKEAATKTSIEESFEHASFIRSLQRTASSAAAVALLALIAFVAAQLPSRSNNEPQIASMGIERIAQREPAVSDFDRPADPERALVLILNTPADGMCIVDPSERRPAPAAVELFQKPDRYCLVVASLASNAEANVFMGHYSDRKLNLLEKDGRYRVYAASAPTIAGVREIAQADSLYAVFPSAWICRN